MTKAPIFRTSANPSALYVEPRPYATRPTGLTKWFGTGAALVHTDKADKRMKAKGYASECEEAEATDAQIMKLIKEALGKKPVRFTRRFTVKRQNEELKRWVTLGVYASDEDPRLLLLDMALGPPPGILYAAPSSDPVGSAVNTPKAKDVTFLAGCYNIPDEKYENKLRKR